MCRGIINIPLSFKTDTSGTYDTVRHTGTRNSRGEERVTKKKNKGKKKNSVSFKINNNNTKSQGINCFFLNHRDIYTNSNHKVRLCNYPSAKIFMRMFIKKIGNNLYL